MAVARARSDSDALGGVVGGYAPLDSGLLIPTAYLPGTAASYITAASEGALSAEIVRPELGDWVSGSSVDMSGASLGTGVSVSTVHGLTLLTFTNAAEVQWDVTSAIGTGDFDVRARIVNCIPSIASVNFSPFLELVLSATARTASTALMMQMYGKGSLSSTISFAQGVINGVVQGKPIMGMVTPIVLRVSRVGTTVSFWASSDNGLTWANGGTATSSLSVGKIGLWVCANTHTEAQAMVEYIRQ